MALKINDISGINATFEAVPDLKEVFILEDGRHYFNEDHAKAANGFEARKKDDKTGKLKPAELKKVKYTKLERGAKELKEEAAAA